MFRHRGAIIRGPFKTKECTMFTSALNTTHCTRHTGPDIYIRSTQMFVCMIVQLLTAVLETACYNNFSAVNIATLQIYGY